MLLTTVFATGAEKAAGSVPPEVFGVTAFTILLALLVALLMFGKGRPHS